MAFKKTLLPRDYQKTINQRTKFEQSLAQLLKKPFDENHPIAVSLQNRLIKYQLIPHNWDG
jgi:hypothetical protein